MLQVVLSGLRSELHVRIFENKAKPVVAEFINKFNLIIKEDDSGFCEPSIESIIWASMELRGYMMEANK